MVEAKRQIAEHLWEEGTMNRLGETGRRMGSLVLSWGAVKHGAADPSDGKNVVLHEFAHQLDFENDAVDGVPALATREQQLAWTAVMRSEFASLRAADESGVPTLLDTYGATDPAEFFAVSVEAFFEQPHALRARHPKLYAELRNYFQQDPVEFFAEKFRRGTAIVILSGAQRSRRIPWRCREIMPRDSSTFARNDSEPIAAAGRFEDMASALSSLADNASSPLRPRQSRR